MTITASRSATARSASSNGIVCITGATAGFGAATARRFAEELTRWFPGHADYLDSALAAWMVKRRHGGKPVVLRRQIA